MTAPLLDAEPLIHGQTFEEMTVGSAFRTAWRTITESDMVMFRQLTGFTEPLFLDSRHAGESGYSGTLVPGMLTFAYAEGLVLQTNVLHGTGIAFMHTEVDWLAPVYVGRHHFGHRRGDRVAAFEVRRARRGHHAQHRGQPARRDRCHLHTRSDDPGTRLRGSLTQKAR